MCADVLLQIFLLQVHLRRIADFLFQAQFGRVPEWLDAVTKKSQLVKSEPNARFNSSWNNKN